MALHHSAITVGTTPTLLTTVPGGVPYTQVSIFNADNSNVFLGDATVSTSGANQGIQVVKNTVIQIWLEANDQLYAISAAGTTANAVTVLYAAVF